MVVLFASISIGNFSFVLVHQTRERKIKSICQKMVAQSCVVCMSARVRACMNVAPDTCHLCMYCEYTVYTATYTCAPHLRSQSAPLWHYTPTLGFMRNACMYKCYDWHTRHVHDSACIRRRRGGDIGFFSCSNPVFSSQCSHSLEIIQSDNTIEHYKSFFIL